MNDQSTVIPFLKGVENIIGMVHEMKMCTYFYFDC